MTMNHTTSLGLGAICCAVTLAASCTGAATAQDAPAPDETYLQAAESDMAWFTEARFGMFVHWGPVSLKGTEIGWSRGGLRRGLPDSMRNEAEAGVPKAEYDALYQRFDPVNFDPGAWVAIMLSAGMKYLVFTTKHHDGFCMFDSALTDYDIGATPFKRDIVRELAEACRKAGIKVGWYYSPPDWHHPDYYTEHHERYIKYLHGQVRELLTNYGKIDIMWFDGLYCTEDKLDSRNLFRMIRSLQPHILINNRCGLPGDYDTPEQTIGRYQDTRPWESCITIGTQWAWKPNDHIKPLKECIQTLVQCAGGDGNLLFNVGPRPDGTIDPEQAGHLKGMGLWLHQYGETVYGTRGGPYRPGDWGVSTRRGATAYLHILHWPTNEIRLAPMPSTILSSRLLTAGEVTVTQTDDAVTIAVPEAYRKDVDTIVVLQLDRPVDGVLLTPSGARSVGKPTTANNWWDAPAGRTYAPERATDDDPDTRWASAAGTSACWLEVDLGEPVTISRASITEFGHRVQAFTIEYRTDPSRPWQQATTGTTIGPRQDLTFPPVTARYVRLNIAKTTAEPTIYEFRLFGPE